MEKEDLQQLYHNGINPNHFSAMVILHEALSKMFPKEFTLNENHESEFTLNSTILEFATLLNWEQNFNKEYEQKKQIAPFWKLALEYQALCESCNF